MINNGSLCNSICINGVHFVVRETCAFDSILQVVMCALVSYNSYKDTMAETDNSLFILAQEILKSGKLKAKHYVSRGQILCDIPIFEKSTYTRKVSSLNANCNAAHLAEYLFMTTPSLIKTKICQKCNHSNIRNLTLVNIDVNVILQNGLNCIQQAIENATTHV